MLLARVLDKLEQAQNRGVPAHTPFLSPGEQASVTDLLHAWGRPRHLFWGGYPDSERRICLFLADWQEEDDILQDPPYLHRTISGIMETFSQDHTTCEVLSSDTKTHVDHTA